LVCSEHSFSSFCFLVTYMLVASQQEGPDSVLGQFMYNGTIFIQISSTFPLHHSANVPSSFVYRPAGGRTMNPSEASVRHFFTPPQQNEQKFYIAQATAVCRKRHSLSNWHSRTTRQLVYNHNFCPNVVSTNN
jgi:hypothetical protein